MGCAKEKKAVRRDVPISLESVYRKSYLNYHRSNSIPRKGRLRDDAAVTEGTVFTDSINGCRGFRPGLRIRLGVGPTWT
jgi:hypothetical protein